MPEYKLSKYNFIFKKNENYCLFYNALSDVILPISKSDITSLEALLEDLVFFEIKQERLFRKLIEYGFVVKEGINELSLIKFFNKRETLTNKNYRLTINPTLDCNMNCWYCSVDSAGIIKQHIGMSQETINGIKKYVEDILLLKKATSIFLDWFGGEPLLYFEEVIYPISMHCLQSSLKSETPFTNFITTNGYLIEQFIDKFDDICLNEFQVTIDGNKDRHDKIRKHKGAPSFDIIFKNIIMVLERIKNSKVILRINYDKKTLANINEVIYLIPVNLRNRVTVSFTRIFQIDKWTDNENDELLINKELFEKAGYQVHYWAFRPRLFHRCYADSINHMVINYDGLIHKCSARNYNIEDSIGKINTKGDVEWNLPVVANYFSCAPFENDNCLDCKYLPICMGQCVQVHYEIKKGRREFECLMNDTDISLESYVQSEALLRNLLN